MAKENDETAADDSKGGGDTASTEPTATVKNTTTTPVQQDFVTEGHDDTSKVIEKKKKQQHIPPVDIQPKPKLSKSERRELQEKQRAEKANRQQQPNTTSVTAVSGTKPPTHGKPSPTGSGGGAAASIAGSGNNKMKEKTAPTTPSTLSNVSMTTTPTKTPSSLVSHLPTYQDPTKSFHVGATIRPILVQHGNQHHHLHLDQLHPLVIQTGYYYATGQIRGGNERCRAMLRCYLRVLRDFVPPPSTVTISAATTTTKPQTDIRTIIDRDILKPSFQYWTECCRPHSVSMGNAFTYLKTAVNNTLTRDMDWTTMFTTLEEIILAYERERIDYADLVIADIVCSKILYSISHGTNKKTNSTTKNIHHNAFTRKDEVILTYGNSEVVRVVLKQAAESIQKVSSHTKDLKKFRVIVVDSSPLYEGRLMLQYLRENNIQCTYCLLSSVTYVLKDVTKLLLGAASLSSDGSVFGRVGTAVVAMAAHHQHVPVLICSETYKISNRVFTESLTCNEMGNPDDVFYLPKSMDTGLYEKQPYQSNNCKRLNLLYDLTPAEFISGIVTELGIIPPSSIAVLLMEMNPPGL